MLSIAYTQPKGGVTSPSASRHEALPERHLWRPAREQLNGVEVLVGRHVRLETAQNIEPKHSGPAAWLDLACSARVLHVFDRPAGEAYEPRHLVHAYDVSSVGGPAGLAGSVDDELAAIAFSALEQGIAVGDACRAQSGFCVEKQ